MFSASNKIIPECWRAIELWDKGWQGFSNPWLYFIFECLKQNYNWTLNSHRFGKYLANTNILTLVCISSFWMLKIQIIPEPFKKHRSVSYLVNVIFLTWIWIFIFWAFETKLILNFDKSYICEIPSWQGISDSGLYCHIIDY